ncbi:MAG: hypothetical protein HOH43_18385 [Candidatus Latescibacteria bacterium]|jgi:phosphoenolpyruvate synthase/pyruvate phosphate dikinase|nr:hypothetical protein [Candidatus Latescibacterota bacterium]
MSILWLGDSDCHDVTVVGGKVANLSRLAADYRVPPGFCLSTDAYNRWSHHFIDQPDPQHPETLIDSITQAYTDLAGHCEVSHPSVAVRSSAIDEDGYEASFAGQYETFLNVSGVDSVAEAIGKCWHSAGSSRVAEYRKKAGLTESTAGLAVLVQQLVAADTSAVVFSANPVTGNRDEVVINASWGLGESVVGGTVSPDTYTVRKNDYSVVERRISRKDVMTVSIPGGTQEVAVPRFLKEKPALSDEQIQSMAGLAISLETEMAWPVDIECAIHDGNLYLLQCRHITTLDQS